MDVFRILPLQDLSPLSPEEDVVDLAEQAWAAGNEWTERCVRGVLSNFRGGNGPYVRAPKVVVPTQAQTGDIVIVNIGETVARYLLVTSFTAEDLRVLPPGLQPLSESEPVGRRLLGLHVGQHVQVAGLSAVIAGLVKQPELSVLGA